MAQGYYTGSSSFENVNEVLNEAELYRDQALEYSIDSLDYSNQSLDYKTQADAAAAASQASATASSSSASDSAGYAGSALTYSISAQGSATAASVSESAAASSANSSEISRVASEDAATASAASAAASASSASASAASAAAASATITSIGQRGGSRNKIINGAMAISQRGTTFLNIAGGSYSLDRWKHEFSGLMLFDVYKENLGLNVLPFSHNLKTIVRTVDTSIGASDFSMIQQPIEGYNIEALFGVDITLSFYVHSSVAGTYCVALRSSNSDRSYVREYTINAPNTWQKVTITIPGGLPNVGTWNNVYTRGLDVCWTLACGSTFQTTPNAWQAGNFIGTANQVNFVNTVSNTFRLTGVQLEVGSEASPYEFRDIGMELNMCLRYYEVMRVQFLSTLANGSPFYNYKQPKRDVPTVTYTYDSGGGGGTFAAEVSAAIQTVTHSIQTNGQVRINAEI